MLTEAQVGGDGDEPDLGDPSLYINRELSWLDFNERVLELAEDENLPLLERLKFLAIYTSNLDEFFMVRVAGVHEQIEARIDRRYADGLSPTQLMEEIARKVRALDARHARQFSDVIRPALAAAGHPHRLLRRIGRHPRAARALTSSSTSSRC